MQVTPQQSLYLECSTRRTGCDVRLVDRESSVGVDTNMVRIREDETPCL